MTILHIDSSISGASSVSRELSAEALARITALEPGAKVIYRDLAETPLDHYVITDKPGNDTPGAASAAAILDEFLGADTIIIGAPLYNFTISSQLKAWIDRLVLGGKTFEYNPDGWTGLAGGRRVIILVSRGAIYQPGSPWAPFEHAESLLKSIFNFIGIEPEIIVAEGIAFGPEARAGAIAAASAQIAGLQPRAA